MHPISSRTFAIIYCVVLGWCAVSALLGFAGYYFWFLLSTSSLVLVCIACMLLALEVVKRYPTMPAAPEDIKREDDVLLQGITFISAVLFFYVNILISNTTYKFWISLMIFLASGSFYFFRAIAKIRSNRYYRLVSVFFLVWVASSYIFEFTFFFFPAVFPIVLTLPPLIFLLLVDGLAALFFLSVSLTVFFSAQRYGFRPRRHEET